MIIGNVDVLVISETELDESLPIGQFQVLGHTTPFRVDRDWNEGETMVFVRQDIPVRYLSTKDKPIEAFFFELILCKNKSLVSCSYNPYRNNIASYLPVI